MVCDAAITMEEGGGSKGSVIQPSPWEGRGPKGQ